MSGFPNRRSLRGWLLAFPTLALFSGVMTTGAQAQSVDFGGSTYTNDGLVGVARVPASARDLFGDTLSLGSGTRPAPSSPMPMCRGRMCTRRC